MERAIDFFSIEVWVGGGVLLLLAILVLVRRWGRSGSAHPAPHSLQTLRSRIKASKVPPPSSLDLPKVISHYRARYPAFFRIMSDFQRRHSLEELLSDPQLAQALSTLAERGAAPAPPSKTSYLRLEENSDATVQAAIVTLIRGIYQSRAYCENLSPQTHAEIDRLLDGLDRRPAAGIE